MYRQICYLSTAQSEFGDDVLGEILDVSRRNNAADGLSGMLSYGAGVFFQVLEGPAAPLERTLKRIAGDPRHFGMKVLQDTMQPQRDFGEWRMAYRALDADLARRLAHPGFLDADALPAIVQSLGNPLIGVFLTRIVAQGSRA